MSEFEERLKAAAARGSQKGVSREELAATQKATQDRLRGLHTTYRLQLSERIDVVVRKLIDQFPGFRIESIFGELGWGSACKRDNLRMINGRRESRYSRFEMAVRPVNDYLVLDLHAKGTVANKEVLVRNFYQPLAEVDHVRFQHLIEDWALSFAELYAAS